MGFDRSVFSKLSVLLIRAGGSVIKDLGSK